MDMGEYDMVIAQPINPSKTTTLLKTTPPLHERDCSLQWR